jgi:hypothetical protein
MMPSAARLPQIIPPANPGLMPCGTVSTDPQVTIRICSAPVLILVGVPVELLLVSENACRGKLSGRR